ncbi:MAG: recombinase family protein [Planctomycetota bacterium]
MERWLRGHGFDPATVTWYVDRESGANTDRPAFAALREAIFLGEVDTVVVWKLDRLSRKQREGIDLLADWCEQGVRVVSVTQQLDLDGAIGRIVAGVLFGVAEMELEHTRERQAAGIAAAKARGVYRNHGRKKGATKADPKRAAELKASGLKVTEIAKALGVSRSVIYEYLKPASDDSGEPLNSGPASMALTSTE